VIGVNKIWQQGKLAQSEEFFDALRRHICLVLGYDYGLIDVVLGHEVVNLLSFSSEDDAAEIVPLLQSLSDEHQQPLTVAHTLTAQKVKQTQRSWLGHVDDESGKKYPYLIVPVIADVDGQSKTIGLVRVVAFDDSKVISEDDVRTLQLFAANLADKLRPFSAQHAGGAEGASAAKNIENSVLPAGCVLVAHSQRVSRRRLSRALAGHYQVSEADDAGKAMEALNAGPIDLIVIDSGLSGESGFDFCRQLKDSPKWKHIPCVLIIAGEDSSLKVSGLEAGADDCLMDSFVEAELLARVRSLIQHRKAEMELAIQLELLEDYSQKLEHVHDELTKARQISERDRKELYKAKTELEQRHLESDKRLAQDQLLHRISNIIRRSFDIKTNVDEMLEALAGYFNLDCCFLILPADNLDDSVRGEYVTNDDYSLKRRDLDLAILETFTQKFNWDSTIFVSDVVRERRPEEFLKGPLQEQPIQSLFYVPVTYDEKVLGLLGGHKCESEAHWTSDNVSFFRQVADQIASGVTNARLYACVQRQATTDGLTGLYNHRAAQERLAEQLRLAERYSRNLSVIMMDVDFFKTINDRYGHQAGDFVLRYTGRLLRTECRDVDIPARYGGEEFMIILPEVHQEGAVVLAERIRKSISKEPIPYEDTEIPVSASFGVASFPDDARGQEELLVLADKAMYMSKRLGRNQVHTAKDLMFAQYIEAEAELEAVHETNSADLQEAVEEASSEEHHTSEASSESPEVVDMIKSLATQLYEKSEYNKVHHLETARFAELLAKVLGLTKQQVNHIRVASLLHDVGVLSIPEQILDKPGPLSADEMEMIKRHPAMGAQLLRPIKALKEVCEILEYHHEHWDGTGYPSGLRGEQIPVASRIIAIVDSYHALISNRPYRPALSRQEARDILRQGAGIQWDPFLVDMFIAVLDSLEQESKH
jgi:diguanylate cyclase (GGDEF)-like protein/putative nucleotidyltransferase with HDIG domain